MIDFTFIAERYNYWIFIILMMIGLYTVISRGNLIKKMVGLYIFQTSVFIYYISVGKIAGGTAPIIIGGEGHRAEGEAAHDALDKELSDLIEAGKTHAQSELHVDPDIIRNPPPGDETFEVIRPEEGSSSLEVDAGRSIHAAPSPRVEGFESNDLSSALSGTEPGAQTGHEALHAAPTANPPLTAPDDALITVPPPSFDIAPPADAAQHVAGTSPPLDALHQAAEIIYTNPLPHVLILTAIVVGVATTAVGLALAVRIREAYGTIEEDELEAADDIAEFGRIMTGKAGA